jgi:hypothetical protein
MPSLAAGPTRERATPPCERATPPCERAKPASPPMRGPATPPTRQCANPPSATPPTRQAPPRQPANARTRKAANARTHERANEWRPYSSEPIRTRGPVSKVFRKLTAASRQKRETSGDHRPTKRMAPSTKGSRGVSHALTPTRLPRDSNGRISNGHAVKTPATVQTGKAGAAAPNRQRRVTNTDGGNGCR